jgi:hypothetical protein
MAVKAHRMPQKPATMWTVSLYWPAARRKNRTVKVKKIDWIPRLSFRAGTNMRPVNMPQTARYAAKPPLNSELA